MSDSSNLDHLRDLREKAILGGGTERIEGQHKRGKLTARERLELLLDKGSLSRGDWYMFFHRTSQFLGEV
jgi:propionyl-CoA carboxylase beta chain